MPWVRFNKPYSHHASRNVVVDYPVGDFNVPTKCASVAVHRGDAVRLQRVDNTSQFIVMEEVDDADSQAG